MSHAARITPARSFSGFFPLLALLILGLAASAWAVAPSIVLITRGFDGQPTITASDAVLPAVSADGKYVAFQSYATNFLPGAQAANIFVKNTETGALELASVGFDGASANSSILALSMSADGRFVAFRSLATNLVPNDTNNAFDIFVRDRQLGVTERVNVGSDGVQANGDSDHPVISADGRFVAFDSAATNLVPGVSNTGREIYVRDRLNGTTEWVSRDTRSSRSRKNNDFPSISADGRFIVFRADLDEQNQNGNILVRDRQEGTTTIIDFRFRRNGGSETPAISSNGRYIVFRGVGRNALPSEAYNAGDIFWYDRETEVTEQISVREGGIQAQSQNYDPTVSDDGRYVAFRSYLRASTPGEGLGFTHRFLRDRQSGVTTRFISGANRNLGNDTSYEPILAKDGRSIVFASDEDGLVPEDSNHHYDVFQYQRKSGVVQRVSVGENGQEGKTRASSFDVQISADGRFLAFQSNAENLVPGDSNGRPDIFVKNLLTGSVQLVSLSSNGTQGNGTSGAFLSLSISADGRYIAFTSEASNLVAGDSNGREDVFVRDRLQGKTERVNIGQDGAEADWDCNSPSISADGRYVAYLSFASNLLVVGSSHGQVLVRDRKNGTTELISQDQQGGLGNSTSTSPAMSADGRYVAFQSAASNLVAGDTNGADDIFVRDRQLGLTERVNVGLGGVQANKGSLWLAISGNGRYVAFSSDASNLVTGTGNGFYNVFVRDRQQGTLERVSVATDGTPQNRHSLLPALSGDGRYVSFYSNSTNLVPNDTNAAVDIFLRDRQLRTTKRVSVGAGGIQANDHSERSTLSGDGRFVAFNCYATNLVLEPTNGSQNVYLVDRQAAPFQLRATALSSTRIRLDWRNTRVGQTSFLLQRRSGSGAWVSLAAIAPTATSYVDTSLNPRTTYTYQLRSNGPDGYSAYSEEASATTLAPAVPSTPTTLRVLNHTATSVALAWGDVSPVDETGYQLYRHTAATGWALVQTLPANTTRFTDSGLTSNTRYTYYLTAFNAAGASPASNSVAVTTLVSPPAAPTSLAAAVKSQTRIDLAWTDASTDESGFKIERRQGAGTYAQIGTTAANLATFSNTTGLAANTIYTYRVRAYNAGGDSAYSNEASATTLPNAPAAPAGLTATAKSQTQIDLVWQDKSNNEVGFRLERRTGSAAFTLLASPVAGAVSYTDAALTANTTAVYRLRAYNTGGESANSNEASAKTLLKLGGQLVVSPLKINFGKVKLKKHKLATLTIRNGSGTERLRVTVNPPTAPFTLQATVGTVELAPGAQTSAGVLFSPRKTKKVTGNLSINSSDSAKSAVNVKLVGSGRK